MMRGGKLGLAGLGLVLACVIALELGHGPGVQTATQAAAPAVVPTRATGATSDAERGAWVKTALARPLFSQTRRPPAQAAAPVAGPHGLPRLTGVMTGPFGRRAVFAGPDGGKPLVVETGDSVGEFRVQSIDGDEVTLTGPDGTRHLRPSFAEGSNGPAETPPPPPQPRRIRR